MIREEQFQDWAKPPDITEERKSENSGWASFLIPLFAVLCALLGGVGADPGVVPPGLPFTLKWRNAVNPLMSVAFAADGRRGWAVGPGGAIILPLSLTILTTAFPAERRGMIVGVYGGLAGLAVAMGPIVGGAVTQGIDWHWIFWINVPIGAVALPFAIRLLPDSYGAPERLDLLGVTLLTGGVVAIVWALVRANQSGWAW